MNIHKNARLTPLHREEMALSVIEGRLSKAEAAQTYGVSAKIVARWVERFTAEGREGMADRTSAGPNPKATGPAVVERIIVLRCRRFTGKHIGGRRLAATVSRVLRRLGLSRLKDMGPVRRYERAYRRGLIPIDIKEPGRFERVGHRITGDCAGQSNSRCVGWEFADVCIDDPRLPGLRQGLPRSRSPTFLDRPYTPKTDGKAERFIQTALNGARAITSTWQHRAAERPVWLHRYKLAQATA